jgi:hypothetical protein
MGMAVSMMEVHLQPVLIVQQRHAPCQAPLWPRAGRGPLHPSPEEAVVVAGARAIARGPGRDWGLALYTPVIVKYRDARTDAKLQLEDLLR